MSETITTYWLLSVVILVIALATGQAIAEGPGVGQGVLSQQQWDRLDRSVEQGFSWLSTQQKADGSFETIPVGQPGVTSLCVMAYMSHGHLPGSDGPGGDRLQRSVDYAVACQKPSGLLASVAPPGRRLDRNVSHLVGSSAAYNHAITGIMLCEAYGSTGAMVGSDLHRAIDKAVRVTLTMQQWPKDRRADRGGWRYLVDFDTDDSDVSITGWQLMFLRAAKNAGFDIPDEPIKEAVAYIRRCHRPRSRTFVYATSPPYTTYASRGVTGAGVLALSHASQHSTPEALASADWLLEVGFNRYNRNPASLERYHYGLLTCTQAMYQLGGSYWERFYPSTVETLLKSQRANGSWDRESHNRDAAYGNAYTTAICLTVLGTPNDLLPIFQR